MTKIKHFTQVIVILCLAIFTVLIFECYFSSLGYTKGTKTKSTQVSKMETERILSEWKARLEKDNKLYSYAVKLYKAPIKSLGKINIFDGYKYGEFQFIFPGEKEFKIETLPPEITIFRLITPKGFSDEKEAISILRQCVQDKGLNLNWRKPIEECNGNERIIKYESFADGDNSAAMEVYKNEKLIEIRYHIAL